MRDGAIVACVDAFAPGRRRDETADYDDVIADMYRLEVVDLNG